MIGAGLLARNAVARGLRVPPTVKTSLAPGSQGGDRLPRPRRPVRSPRGAGLRPGRLRLHDLHRQLRPARRGGRPPGRGADGLVATAVLSGNRNFEGRIHPLARASYLASPPLVVAFALAGRIDLDLTREPLGIGDDGRPGLPRRHLAHRGGDPRGHRGGDRRASSSGRRTRRSSRATSAGRRCRSPPATATPGTRRRPTSPARRSSPGSGMEPAPVTDIAGARVLAWLGDSVTTDHISPAGSIPAWSPAGGWLQEHGRGAGRLQLVRRPARPSRGDDARHVREHPPAQRRSPTGRRARTRGSCPSGEEAFLYDAAMAYQAAGVPAIVLAGPRVRLRLVARLGGQGDAAPGRPGGHRRELRADPPLQPRGHGRPAPPVPAGRERRVARAHRPRVVRDRRAWARGSRRARGSTVVATADPADGGGERRFAVECRLDGPIEVDYYRQGGILPAVLRRIAREGGPLLTGGRRAGRGGRGHMGAIRPAASRRTRPSSCRRMNLEPRPPVHHGPPRRRATAGDTLFALALAALGLVLAGGLLAAGGGLPGLARYLPGGGAAQGPASEPEPPGPAGADRGSVLRPSAVVHAAPVLRARRRRRPARSR